MNWLKSLFGGKKDDTQEIARLLETKTGDPAFLHKTNWIVAYGKKNYPLALAELDKALQIVPGNAHYLALRGMTKWAMQNRSGAYADFAAARQSDPAQKEVGDLQNILTADARQCRDQARALAKNGRFTDTLAMLDNAVAVEPDNAENFYFRGMIKYKAGNMNAAIADVTRALQIDPHHAGAQEILQPMKNMAARQ
jgi:tetratricopeptide (TPR) repeat protein